MISTDRQTDRQDKTDRQTEMYIHGQMYYMERERKKEGI